MQTNKISNTNTKTNTNTNSNNKSNSYNQLEKPTLIDSIVSKAKSVTNSNNNLVTYLIVITPILFLLAFILYKYNFGSRSANVVANMGYKTKITLQPMQECYNIDIKQQYKLCDYYISSSFMTPCVGNQHYDYVSLDMINEVIQSGARYIQLPICEADVTLTALPVVGTAVYGQKLITSLNTLEIKSVLKSIRSLAFKINNKLINYPLIIHLILNTNNTTTINILADNISETLGDVLLDASKYKDFPIFLEKLCSLQGKIILFCTSEYMGTKLEPFIVPTKNLFNIYHFSELDPINVPSDTIYKNEYNKKLSSKEQTKSNDRFKKKYPSIDYIINNANSIGDTILADTEILNNLTSFNKVGITVVKPHYPDDVISKNFDISESVYYGCQIVAMNFQVNDINMTNYLSIFKESSFRLKPDSLRFSEAEEPVKDMLKIYKSIIPNDTKIINDFYYKYNNCLIAFESYTLQNTYLTQVETNLRFQRGGEQIRDKMGNIKYKLNVNQCFIPRKSKVSSANNISVYLESASTPGLFITMNSGLFDLQELSNNKKTILSQALYIEYPKTVDKDTDGEMLSIKTTDDSNPMYLAYENKLVKAYADTTQIEAHNNMTFILHKIAFRYIIKIITVFDGSLKTMGGNIIGVLQNNNTDGTEYYAIPMQQSSNNNVFNIFKDQFILQNKKKKTYVVHDPISSFLYDREVLPNRNGTFNIVSSNGYYKILNTNNDNLALVNKNLIKFVNESEISTNENLFMINISYELV